jgi:hypothetical protein
VFQGNFDPRIHHGFLPRDPVGAIQTRVRATVSQARMAEREGFEPPEPRGSTVFKTAAIDHSATSPSGTS